MKCTLKVENSSQRIRPSSENPPPDSQLDRWLGYLFRALTCALIFPKDNTGYAVLEFREYGWLWHGVLLSIGWGSLVVEKVRVIHTQCDQHFVVKVF
jgi:hypothetical protein